MKNFSLSTLAIVLTIIGQPAFAATAVLAGGCFWCMESDFEKLDGVSDVVSGFSGGTHPDPTYKGDHSGHYEVVEITYDPEIIDYQGILDYFWVNHDPFDDAFSHAVLVIGISANPVGGSTDIIHYFDPSAEGTQELQALESELFEVLWDRSEKAMMVVVRPPRSRSTG